MITYQDDKCIELSCRYNRLTMTSLGKNGDETRTVMLDIDGKVGTWLSVNDLRGIIEWSNKQIERFESNVQ